MYAEPHDLPTRTVDCLRLIYKLEERGERVTTSTVRERLEGLERKGQLSDATVTQLFKSLASEGYVRHERYHGASLTLLGRAVASQLVRHHRLLELFLTQIMGFGLDEVDAEAERLEHAISEAFEERMDTLLGHPTLDPHGDPIPSKSGEVTVTLTQPLSELALEQPAVVRRVRDDDAEVLRYLSSLGLLPGARVCVSDRAPFGGPLLVRVGDERGDERGDEQGDAQGDAQGDHQGGAVHALGPQLAAGIQVAPVGAPRVVPVKAAAFR